MSTARVWDSGAGEWLSVTTGGSPVVRSASPPSRKDVIWVDTSDTQSGAVPGTIFGAKGEILVGTGAGTYEALPAAPGDGYGITSDTSQTGGVKWVGPAFQVVHQRTVRTAATAGQFGFVLGQGDANVLVGTAAAVGALFYINPTDWGASGVVVRLRGSVVTETAPTSSILTVNLQRANGFTAGAISSYVAAGAGVTATTAAIASANSDYAAVSSDVTLTTAGVYFVLFDHDVDPAQRMTYGYTLMGRPA